VFSTLLTALGYSVGSFTLNENFCIDFLFTGASYRPVFSVFFGIIGLQLVHEIAHRVAARLTDLKVGLPFPLPSLQIGSLGCITPIWSYPESRTNLFDFVMAGPAATMICSLLAMFVGLNLTINSSTEALSYLPVFPVALLKGSALVGWIVSCVAPKVTTLPLSQPVPLHPLFVVRFQGAICSALNALPIGRLDGGRAATALLGRGGATGVTLACLAISALLSLGGASVVQIFFGLPVVLFQRQPEVRIRDEVTGVDPMRNLAFIAILGTSLLTLLPFPGGAGML